MKVPAVIASGVICLILGIGIGGLGTMGFELTPEKLLFWKAPAQVVAKSDNKSPEPIDADAQAMAKAMFNGGKGGPMGKGGGMDFGGMMGKGMWGKTPSAKAQLNSLIAKLDILTDKPLTVSLDEDQKKKIAENLQGLGGLDELTEADAKKRLDGLLEVVKDQKEALTQVGFRWPGAKGGGGFGAPKDVANPFKEEAGAKHLQSLEQRMAKARTAS